jgi:arginine exporter protein ArgO
MREILYDQNSALIASVLFACILLVMEISFRVGRRGQATATEPIRSQINAIQGAVLGLLALLLAFTFSLALQRHDSRSEAVVDEANAIGTAYLRAQLLPADMRDRVGALLREYLDVRIRASRIALDDPTARERLLQQASQITDQLWLYARQAAQQDGRPVTSGLFIQSLNELIDSFGRRDAALSRHVPEVVLFLLFLTFLMAGSILGYASGIESSRATFPMIMMVGLIALLVFLIIDLDRPRRGLIQISQKSLEDLQQSIARPRTGAAQPGSAADAPKASRR